jgi:undecaprenyl-diphosphatase
MSHLTFAEAVVVGLIQGVTELFPVSSLGHNVLIPALIGGQWSRDLSVSAPESPYLAFIVGMHVATAVAMIAYFWRDWVRIIGGLFSSVRERQVVTTDQRLAWMIILATIPVGVAGLALEHAFRVVFSKPIPTALFLAANGVILIGGERLRRRSRDTARAAPAGAPVAAEEGARRLRTVGELSGGREKVTVATADRRSNGHSSGRSDSPSSGSGSRPTEPETARRREIAEAMAADRRLAGIDYRRAVLIGASQILALLPGISRDGIVMVTGMFRGLSREDAVRFSFLLSAPVILAAGALKIPDLTGSLGNGIRGQVLVGSLLSGIGAYLSVRFLVRYFRESRSLTPFGIYCLIAGLASFTYLAVR